MTSEARSRVTQRRCGKCEKDKPSTEFSKSTNRSSWCRSCCAENARKWRGANLERARQYDRDRQDRQRTGKAKEWMRFYRWLSRHGLRPEDYAAMWEAQEGRCAICREEPAEGEFLHIDHDHLTEVRRGLLCPPCNRGLGQFKDDVDRLLAAADYLMQAGILTAG